MNISQLKAIQQNFVKELQDAKNGKKTSLPFIVHMLATSSIVRDREVFQSLVVGGTMAKFASVKKEASEPQAFRIKEQQLSFRTEEDFLGFVESILLQDINVVSLNFAYPLKPIFENGRLDGILLSVTKEGGFHGLVGKKVGEEIEKYVLAKRRKRIKVSVANDTICLLLSGLTKYQWDNLAAGIVGTGLNFAFFLDKEKAVNLESANFDKFPLSEEGKIIDSQSAKKGKAWFEKETAGAYLYKHFNLIIKEKKIKYPQIASTEELDIISRKNISQVSEIAKSLITRSAQLVAAQIAGITELKKRDTVFNMEGSLFWKANNYKETVGKTVKQLVPEYKVRFVEIKDSAILGAAKLVT